MAERTTTEITMEKIREEWTAEICAERDTYKAERDQLLEAVRELPQVRGILFESALDRLHAIADAIERGEG